MSGSLFSPVWYRVAEQQPTLRPEVRVQRQQIRGERWYLLINVVDSRQYRVDATAYEFIGRFDGSRSVQDIWSVLLEQLGDDAPSQDEVIYTLNRLDEHDLLAYDKGSEAPATRRGHSRPRGRFQNLVNPFALRIPLGDPSRVLRYVDPVAPLLFNRTTFWLWVVGILCAVLGAASNWRPLSAHAIAYMGTPRYLFLAWISFPFVKILHELGHALALRRWGGETHEVGFSLFVLMPAPYIDASAAAAFSSRTRRALVGAAGMMVELAIAAVALAVWMSVQSGVICDIAFVVMFIASISTLVFNGNPLLPFDAYYILSDALDLPNLGLRSKAFWTQGLMQCLGRGASPQRLYAAKGERKWLFVYAPASLFYRLFISCVFVLWLGAHSAALGALAALFLAFTVIVKPLVGTAVHVWAATAPGAPRTRAAVICSSTVCAIIIVLGFLPLPFHTLASGVIWPPEQARVRIETDGFIRQMLARDGEHVAPGQVLVVLDDPNLFAQRDALVSRLELLQATRFSALLDSSEHVRNAEEETARVQSQLDRTEQRIEQLKVRARAGGTLVLPQQQDLPDTFVRQGGTIGYVLEHTHIGVRAVLPEYDVTLVRNHTREVHVRLAGNAQVYRAELVRDIPAATYDLPSAALGDRGGGPHVTDPADKDGLRTRDAVVVVDLDLPGTELGQIGGRAWVLFDHGARPLAGRWYRQLRQVLLDQFNPAV